MLRGTWIPACFSHGPLGAGFRQSMSIGNQWPVHGRLEGYGLWPAPGCWSGWWVGLQPPDEAGQPGSVLHPHNHDSLAQLIPSLSDCPVFSRPAKGWFVVLMYHFAVGRRSALLLGQATQGTKVQIRKSLCRHAAGCARRHVINSEEWSLITVGVWGLCE